MTDKAPAPKDNPVEQDIVNAVVEYYTLHGEAPTRITLSRKVLKEYFRHEFPGHTEEALVRRVAMSEKTFKIENIPVTVIPGKSMDIVCSNE